MRPLTVMMGSWLELEVESDETTDSNDGDLSLCKSRARGGK